MFIVENLAINGAYLSADVDAGDTTLTVRAVGNLTAGAAYIWDKNTPAGETVTISSIVGTTVTIAAGLTNSYTIAQDAVITNTGGLAVGGIVEFDIPIPGQWCKVDYVKIVQYTAGAMDISFDIFEKSGIDEAVRRNWIYNIYRRNIDIAAGGGGQYGEALGRRIPYKDQDARTENGAWNLHCRLQNEAGGTASDFGVVIKLADISEVG